MTDATVAERRAAGLAHIPEDRYARGLAREASISDNLLMGRHAEHFLLDRPGNAARARELVAEYDVRAGEVAEPAASLSGGNAQKLVIARELAGEPRVVLASQPTRGVDIGASEFVRAQLRAARDRGAAVLLVSADLDELLTLADRIVVLYEGAIAGEGTNEEELGLLMAGAGQPA